MSELKNLWNKIYAHKRDCEVSWFQTVPLTSLNLIEKYAISKKVNIIDIGGGNSNLSKNLCDKGYKNLSIIDISEEAIERSRAKLSKCKGIHDLYAIDILDFKPTTKYDFWHDRAVFHFLTRKNDIDKYILIASKAIAPKGYLILGTYSKTGPNECSGLPVSQYNSKSLSLLFKSCFELIETFEEKHQTPLNTEQDFVWVVLKKT